MSNTDAGNAKRADRPTLELAKILMDGKWHSTWNLTGNVLKYIRPEIAWRRAKQHKQKGNLEAGGYQWVLGKLRYWAKVGKVEKKVDGGEIIWRTVNGGWVEKYVEYLEHGGAENTQSTRRFSN